LAEFLADLEATRGNDARSRNARLAAIRSFYQYAAMEVPQHSDSFSGEIFFRYFLVLIFATRRCSSSWF
jgi:hypothetical protein